MMSDPQSNSNSIKINSTLPILQPDDVIVCSSSARTCIANAHYEEQYHRPRKKSSEASTIERYKQREKTTVDEKNRKQLLSIKLEEI